jgi:glutamate synthase domain-containing protein 2
MCYTGKCNWGIATQDPYLEKRLNPDVAAERLYNLVSGWSHEIAEMLGGMGLNAIESLRGNRLHLRSIGLSTEEMDILGLQAAGSPMA